MSRKIVALNVLLLALLIWLGMQFRTRWLESKARESAALARAAKPAELVTPPAVPTVDPASPAEYIDVAQRMLFSKDRDPNVIVDAPPPPPPPPPEKPVPPLPSYYGQMNLAEPVIVLSTDRIPQKSYRIGENVGDFKVAAFDRDTVTLEWNDKVLVNQLRDMTPKEAERPVQAAAAPAAAPNPSKAITKMGTAPKPTDPILGPMNGLFPTCLAEDTSPSGTIKDGYVKKITPGMMGPSCTWEPLNR
jgi:hypothetical protein